MSDIYLYRLRRVHGEFNAAREALQYVNQNWNRQDIIHNMEGTAHRDFQSALENLEATYFIRLFALFEGILKEHLATNHPHLHVPEDARAVWLIDRIATLQRPRIVDPLRTRVHEVRTYRNALVHAGELAVPRVTFAEALARLGRYLERLPDPF